MGKFRNHFASLLVLGVFALPLLFASLKAQAGLSSAEANPIVLRMFSFSPVETADQLQAWEDKIIPGNVRLDIIVDGFRAVPGNSMQRAPVGGEDPTTGTQVDVSTKYPVKCQFLVVADVPEGVERINWNILGGSACIIGTPDDSQFIDSSHVVTPVVPTPQTVEIKNTHYAIVTGKSTIKLPDDGWPDDGWEEKLSSYSEGNFYDISGAEKQYVEYKRKFGIGTNQTYIILTATKLGRTDLIASCEGIHPAESLVFAAVEWIEQPKPVESKIREEMYTFVANIVDIQDPLDWDTYLKGGQDIKVQFEISVENKGTTSIPKDLLVFRIYPDIKPNWWSNTPPDPHASVRDAYCFRWSDFFEPTASQLIPVGGEETVTISPRSLTPEAIDPSLQGRTPFEIQNTELYFMGPRSNVDRNGYGIRTNETTTVVAGVPVVSGLASIYDGNMIMLRNQDAGPIYLDILNSFDIQEPKVITGGPEKVRMIPFTGKVATIKFHVKSTIDGKEHRADGSVTLRY